MARHRKPTPTCRALTRGAALTAAAAGGLALLAAPASASGGSEPCTTDCSPGIPAIAVGDLVEAQVKLLHCEGQIADIKAKVLRQVRLYNDDDWAVKARVLVGKYCHKPPVIVVPVPEPAPEPAPAPAPEPEAPEAPAPQIVQSDLPVTH
jgi:hypothetical protein